MKIEKKCIYCGGSFTAQTLSTKYCSPDCNKKHYKVRIKKGEFSTASFKGDSLKKIIFKKQTTLNIKQFLSIKDACELLGLSRSTLYRLIKDNKIYVTKIGSRIIIPKPEIEELLKKSTRTYIPDKVHAIKQNFNIKNYYYIGEIQNEYGVSEKQLYTLILKFNVEKVTIGSFVYVLKSDIKKIFK